jgi:hypothetical protein
MFRKPVLLVGAVVLLLATCGRTQTAPAPQDRLTHYHGTPLPTPDDPAAWQAHPAAWLVVGDQVTAGMYLNVGRAEAGADWAQLPHVTLPPGVDPILVLGEAAIRSAGVWTWDHSDTAATWQTVAVTRTAHDPATYTLAPLTATTPQVLQVGMDYAHHKSLTYGWQVQVAAE